MYIYIYISTYFIYLSHNKKGSRNLDHNFSLHFSLLILKWSVIVYIFGCGFQHLVVLSGCHSVCSVHIFSQRMWCSQEDHIPDHCTWTPFYLQSLYRPDCGTMVWTEIIWNSLDLQSIRDWVLSMWWHKESNLWNLFQSRCINSFHCPFSPSMKLHFNIYRNLRLWRQEKETLLF